MAIRITGARSTKNITVHNGGGHLMERMYSLRLMLM